MKRAAIMTAALALVLTGCSTTSESATGGEVSHEEFLSAYGLAGMAAPEIIDHLDRMNVDERPAELLASVRTDELLLSDNNQEVALDLPENLTYISVAPYLTQTHDCFYHSLTTCLGELGEEPIQVTITDETTGDVLIEEETTTFDNGFIGYWIPDEAAGTIEVTHQGRTGVTEFSATDEGATCLTDLRLT